MTSKPHLLISNLPPLLRANTLGHLLEHLNICASSINIPYHQRHHDCANFGFAIVKLHACENVEAVTQQLHGSCYFDTVLSVQVYDPPMKAQAQVIDETGHLGRTAWFKDDDQDERMEGMCGGCSPSDDEEDGEVTEYDYSMLDDMPTDDTPMDSPATQASTMDLTPLSSALPTSLNTDAMDLKPLCSALPRLSSSLVTPFTSFGSDGSLDSFGSSKAASFGSFASDTTSSSLSSMQSTQDTMQTSPATAAPKYTETIHLHVSNLPYARMLDTGIEMVEELFKPFGFVRVHGMCGQEELGRCHCWVEMPSYAEAEKAIKGIGRKWVRCEEWKALVRVGWAELHTRNPMDFWLED